MPKTARVVILMTPEDKASLFDLAKLRGESVGSTIRALVEAEHDRHPAKRGRRR